MLVFKKLGFTMIELLIVIAIMGILAVAVLAAINPIEQINRGRDTGSRSDAEQLISGSDRFYASKGYYPWQLGASSVNYATFRSGGSGFTPLSSAGVLVGEDQVAMLTNLSSAGTEELKASFVSRISDPAQSNTLNLYNDGVSGHSTYVCFLPKSQSFRTEAWTRCSTNGVANTMPVDFPPGGCPNTSSCATAATAANATTCQICLP